MITRDLIERVVATFVQAAIGAMSSHSMFDLGESDGRCRSRRSRFSSKGSTRIQVGNTWHCIFS